MEKVAVLGGGVGGMAAAFELTRPEHRGRFEVTVYQQGFRLGGKGASGRALDRAARIEEHGLHVWFGFYANAFRLLADAYEELERPDLHPLRTIEDAFKPCDKLAVLERDAAGGWVPSTPGMPTRDGVPWEPHCEPTLAEVVEEALRFLGARQRENVRDAQRLADAQRRAAAVRQAPADVAHAELCRIAADLAKARPEALAEAEQLPPGSEGRLGFTLGDVLVATLTGICVDDLLAHGVQSIDGEDWTAWLRRHGATHLTVGRRADGPFMERCALLRAVYDVAFAFPGGVIENASAAAGTATNLLLRLMLTYRGHAMYKMNAGMGDVVFAPLYEVLRARGVKFRFFHAVTGLGLAVDANVVDRIDVVAQTPAARYRPPVAVAGVPCWPNEPRWDQLEQEARGHDFEHQVNPLGRPTATLRRGSDFDQVVLAIPVGVHRRICPQLIARSPRFRAMVESSATVATQSFQLWMHASAQALGWAPGPDSVGGAYVEPLDTYCDMTHLREREQWAEDDGVQGIAYFAGVLTDAPEGESWTDAQKRTKSEALAFLSKDIGGLWPKGSTAGELRWELLVDPSNRTGRERFDAQYWRANVDDSERYVLTPAGSTVHRLPSDRSGFDNLKLAGDWTSNGIDGGCVEAAVISGIRAARGLLGDGRTLVNERPAWLRLP